jgi:site-specific DNA-cytosine methylase
MNNVLEAFVGAAPAKRRKVKRSTPHIENNSASRNQHILAALGVKHFRHGLEEVVPVVDLFSCVGGFSTGAAKAGHTIVLAVDNDPIALGIHEANHPEARHRVMTLGPTTQDDLLREIELALGNRRRRWHLHGSPPCTRLSPMRRANQRDETVLEEGVKLGMSLVEWFLDFVRIANPTTFSFEQVNFEPVRNALQTRKIAFPAIYDFEIVKLWEYGVPQTRTRLIGGTPVLIDRLRFARGMRVSTPTTIRDALCNVANLPEEVMYMRSCWSRKADTTQTTTETDIDDSFVNPDAEGRCRSLDQPSWTLMAGKPLTWWDSRFETVRALSVQEYLAIQTFPITYEFPDGTRSCDKYRGIGNAVPPLFVKKMMTVVTTN